MAIIRDPYDITRDRYMLDERGKTNIPGGTEQDYDLKCSHPPGAPGQGHCVKVPKGQGTDPQCVGKNPGDVCSRTGKDDEEDESKSPCKGGYLGKQGCTGNDCILLTPCKEGFRPIRASDGRIWCCPGATKKVLDCINGVCKEVEPGSAKYPEKCSGKKAGDSCEDVITKVLACVNGICNMIDKRVAHSDAIAKCAGKREGDKCGEPKYHLACVDGVCRNVEISTPEAKAACNGLKEGDFCGFRVECEKDEDCKPGYVCRDGRCRPGEPIRCKSDKDCDEGYVCIDGHCVKPEKECKTDAECIEKFGKDYYCYNGRCKKKEVTECETDDDCPEGKVCHNGQCVKPGKECTTNADCVEKYGEGYKCVDGRCVKAEDIDCETDEECPEGYYCGDDNKCHKREDVVGEEFEWSERMQNFLDLLGDRYEYLMKYPRGLTPEERQEIMNFMTEAITAGKAGRWRTTEERLARMGRLGGGLELEESRLLERDIAERLAQARRELTINEIERRFNELMQTTGAASSLLGILSRSEEVTEALNAARRAESRQDVESMLGYLSILMGGQQNYLGPILNAVMSQMGQTGGTDWSLLGYLLGSRLEGGTLSRLLR